ncbi:MAG: ornithine cyclodeaminase family protein [Chloroflexi bacterium]|nr:ornithine cyclodeaminase family protein [Chloroflexota bacterium]
MALLLKEDDVSKLLTMDMALAALEETFRERGKGNAMVRQRTRLAMPGGTQNLMGGWVGGSINAYGLKVYGGPRSAPAPPTGMLVLLYDGSSGRLLSIIEANQLGRMRTGAASGVATKYMARRDASTVGVIGSGNQAATQLEAVCRVRNIRQAWVYSRTQASRQAFAQRMSQELGLPVTAADSGEACVRNADVVITITNSAEPVLKGAWLKQGAHVNAAGSNRMLASEIDDEAIRRADLIVADDTLQARIECGELIAATARGVVRWEQVHELADVLVGRVPGRPAPDSITLFESQGIGTEDVAAARAVYEAALERGLGQQIPL